MTDLAMIAAISIFTAGFTIAIGAIASGIGISATVAAAALLGNLLLIALYLFDPAVREI